MKNRSSDFRHDIETNDFGHMIIYVYVVEYWIKLVWMKKGDSKLFWKIEKMSY